MKVRALLLAAGVLGGVAVGAAPADATQVNNALGSCAWTWPASNGCTYVPIAPKQTNIATVVSPSKPTVSGASVVLVGDWIGVPIVGTGTFVWTATIQSWGFSTVTVTAGLINTTAGSTGVVALAVPEFLT
jgi:hypothetical protein